MNSLALRYSDVLFSMNVPMYTNVCGTLSKYIHMRFSVKCVDKCSASYYDLPPHSPTQQVFLLAAQKRKRNRSSNYLLSIDQNDFERQSDNVVAKLRYVLHEPSFHVGNGEGFRKRDWGDRVTLVGLLIILGRG